MFIVLQRRVVHAVGNSTEDGVGEEDGYERSGTMRQPVTSSVILLHNPTFNALTAIS